MKPRLVLLFGIALVVLASALWHGALGQASARYAFETEELARRNLAYYEMGHITPFVEREPLTRRLWLAGEADDFQRAELARILSDLPQVADVQWLVPGGGGTVSGVPLLPLIVEVELAGLAAFGAGLLVAFFLFGRARDPYRYEI
ncbi:hypothetical protein [Sphingomicrobium astaxanthinifaciens]|uniref:hypothetical protein n=1 Tax=Sphingomicrobium astaxanthinifaciens TaxID=1227949 RepID=UPI001FCAD5E3|nr:hypothetical protein [Sphingomicrobium astaxanthinifaciens]MCJ7421396.1 hypothetical protein [Sphingomicrobium astaxanthinifaciens]